ncbi:hypothetical protein [Pseudomonas sp. A34-9]|uniref:DUF6932 family protein n=1 Tax=Pseudomonas sp. A34-9 TaxID=3034675 RepID=UPI00240D704A|nr:hypothetical protein [Pseudomonas sp. A34-9]
MSIPDFNSAGYVADQTHQMGLEEFIGVFCAPEDEASKSGGARLGYKPALQSLYKWAYDAGAASLIIGGSFITKKPDPADLDVLVTFKGKNGIPPIPRLKLADKVVLDIQFLAEDEPELLQAYIQLLATDRRGIRRGIVQIKLDPAVVEHKRDDVASPMLEAALLSYTHRHVIQDFSYSKLVIPIHGIRSNADWVPKFTFLASTQGWCVAPFVYGYEEADILTKKKAQDEVLENFRLWLAEIRKTYKGSISIVAHSFGSFIVGRYLQEAKDLQESFGGIVLTGSILHSDYDWGSVFSNESVSMVLNTKAPQDGAVKYMPEFKVPFIKDERMGQAAIRGFAQKHPRLIERTSDLLKHSNMFHDDVIMGVWLPFLNLAVRRFECSNSPF